MRLTNHLQEEMTRLIEPQIPALRRYARLLTRDPSGADDLVQDCLERAFVRWHSRRQGTDVRPWLFSILHNVGIDQIRSTQRRGPQVSVDDVEDDLSAKPPTQEDALLHDDLLVMVDDLPDEQRAVLLLIAVEELSYGEAAAVLGVPVGTIMSRLHRARERLRRAMAGTSDPTPKLRIVQ